MIQSENGWKIEAIIVVEELQSEEKTTIIRILEPSEDE